MEVGSGRQIEGFAPESIGISNLRFRSIRGLGAPIGDPNFTLEVFGILCESRHRAMNGGAGPVWSMTGE
ncbi:hypothetical protein CRG98_044691 [Punica granatum]|uniref:Uncharacterized protein n=1 Tax=Punica granatum TaxID=22663 RepID=A0A2I0HT74_PUNGR|nr:hypothetical protein CRG98_044691 [Punica granatum]